MKTKVPATIHAVITVEADGASIPEDTAGRFLNDLTHSYAGSFDIKEVVYGVADEKALTNAPDLTQEASLTNDSLPAGRDMPEGGELALKIDYLNGYQSKS